MSCKASRGDHDVRNPYLLVFFFLLIMLLPLLWSDQCSAQEEKPAPGLFSAGDAAVTAFSGIKAPASAPSGVHPLDVTNLDSEAPVLQIFDLSKLGGPPAGQLANAPIKLKIKAGEIGQVFGVTFDSDDPEVTPNVYVAATSMFGLQISGKDAGGNEVRLVKGQPGAQWADGQFGTAKGGGPGSIWRIDGATGVVSLFADIRNGSDRNAGPGLGALAYDPATTQLFAADLESGLIHRLDLEGNDLGEFDHGLQARPLAGLDAVAYDPARRLDIENPNFDIETPATWGFADKRRMAFALAVQSNRLYYSVAEGPEIWSVGIGDDGNFANDAKRELAVAGTPTGNLITSILFDGPGTMYLTQRGDLTGSYDYNTFARPQTSVVLRYEWSTRDKAWKTGADEFAIALEPPHRATNGGFALGYGYNSRGDIDTGKCRQTLWTTGEHLREGTDPARIDKGGPRIVHGLQGMSKSEGKPAEAPRSTTGARALDGASGNAIESGNEPPWESWFVDNDGRHDDAGANGHIGAVAIYTPCGDRIKSRLAEGENGERWPWRSPKRGINITKSCLPAATGGIVTCRITITNNGTSPARLIQFTDAATLLAGPGAGGTVTFASAQPDAADWTCSALPSSNLSCWLPPGTLQPGQSRFVNVTVNTGPNAANGNIGFRNCASLAPPYGGTACTNSTGGEIATSKTGPAACTPGGACTFTLTITNTSKQPYSGTVLISDNASPLGASSSPVLPIAALTPPLGCATEPTQTPFSCVAPVTLGPGQSTNHTVTVTAPPIAAGTPGYWLQNCLAANDAANFPAPAAPNPFSAGPLSAPNNVTCVWVRVGNPAPVSNLAVTKRSLGKCTYPRNRTSGIGGRATCTYQITLTNNGPSPFNGPVQFAETIPAAGTLSFPAPWTCPLTAGVNQCSSNRNIRLAPGATQTVSATVTIASSATGPSCLVPNTIAIAVPVPGPANVNAADDTATAIASTRLLSFRNKFGQRIVACDPTNLKVTKTADGPCVETADGTQCKFTVNVANTGPDPYDGPLSITEDFGGNPTKVAFSEDWTCKGTGSTRVCEHPIVVLDPPVPPAGGTAVPPSGIKSVTLNVTATYPKSKSCTVKNTATLTSPPADTVFNGDSNDDSAEASARLPNPDCQKKSQCTPRAHEIRSSSGDCFCERGFVRARTGECAGPDGKIVAEQPPPATQPTSPPPQTTQCPDGKPTPRNGVCPCPGGGTWNRSTASCESACTPGPNESATSSGQCVCHSGYERGGSGLCVPKTGGQRCELGPNEVRDDQGRCVCQKGNVRNSSGACVELAGGRPNRPKDPEPRDDHGPTPYETCRQNGQIYKNGECVDKPSERCRSDEYFDKKAGRCKTLESQEDNEPARKRCDKGQFLDKRGICQTIEKQQPEIDPLAEERVRCKKTDGIWDGRKCRAQPEAPKPKTDPFIDKLNADKKKCDRDGGLWDGRRCRPPDYFDKPKKPKVQQEDDHGPTPAETCRQNGQVYKDGVCVDKPQKQKQPTLDDVKKGLNQLKDLFKKKPKGCPAGEYLNQNGVCQPNETGN